MKTRDEIITELRKVLKAKAVNEEDKVKATKITDLVNCLYVLTDVLCDALMKEDKTMKENSLELLVGMVNNLKRNFINLKETEGNIIDTSSKKERPFASREKIEEEGKIGENKNKLNVAKKNVDNAYEVDIVDLFEDREILLFRNYKKKFAGDGTNGTFSPDEIKFLEGEFEKYIYKLRALWGEFQDSFSMELVFIETNGNEWTRIRAELIEPILQKVILSEDNRKKDRIANIEDKDEDEELPQRILH